MTRRDACDWLSVRLPMWVESQGNATIPKDVEGVRVAFSDEGGMLATADKRGVIRLWDMRGLAERDLDLRQRLLRVHHQRQREVLFERFAAQFRHVGRAF